MLSKSSGSSMVQVSKQCWDKQFIHTWDETMLTLQEINRVKANLSFSLEELMLNYWKLRRRETADSLQTKEGLQQKNAAK